MQLEKETFLRVLKGAPMSVLLCLWVHGSMSRRRIVNKTGWKGDTVDDALIFLEDLNLIGRIHYRKWGLADGFKQLPFPNLLPPEVRKNRTSEILELPSGSAEVRKNRTSAESETPEVRKFRTSLSSSSSVDQKEKGNGENGEEVEAVDNFDVAAYRVLRDRGVGRGFARKLAERPYVTEAYVIDHLVEIDLRHEPLSYALQRIKEAEPVWSVERDGCVDEDDGLEI